jgi:hypothetical protein
VGKSEFILKLLENKDKLFDCTFYRVIFAYPAEDKSRSRDTYLGRLKKICPEAELQFGLPEISQDLFTGQHHILLILDDLGKEAMNSTSFYNIFTKISHHGKLSVFVSMQHMFEKGLHNRNNILNSSHLVLFRNRMDGLSIKTISSHIFNDVKVFPSILDWIAEHLEKDGVRYLVYDGHPNSKEYKYNVITNLFPMSDGIARPIFFPSPAKK